MYMATAQQLTVEEFFALPENTRRHELFDGELIVSPMPRLVHQRAVLTLSLRLQAIIADRVDVELFNLPGDLQLGRVTVVEPDLFIIPSGPGPRPRRWADLPKPIVVAEVLSDATTGRDRGIKRVLYQGAGIAEYWIVDVDAELIERWRPGDRRPEVLSQRLEFALPNGLSGAIDLVEFFAEVLR
jgi:Uma2 family endonuclease